MQAAAAATDIFLSWLNARQGSPFELTHDTSPSVSQGFGITASDGEQRLAIAVQPLFEPEQDAGWVRRCAAVAEQLWQLAGVPLALWIPPETDLPRGDRTEFLHRVVDSAAHLEPGQRGQVDFPVNLTLKKLSDEASYVHVIGGLAPHWARLTGRAYGQYALDTTAIHRLPEPEKRVAELLDWVALLGNGMKAGSTSEVKAEDAWTINRPNLAGHVTVIGAAPDSEPSNGTSVRKLVRAGLRQAAQDAAPAGVTRALVFLGVFRTMDEENATIAIRSCDPSLYSPFDAVCLVADGSCKALVGPRSVVLR